MWHPTLIAEALFAIANIFSSLRLISLFTANSHLGPLQISLGRMLLDILKFLFIYCLVRVLPAAVFFLALSSSVFAKCVTDNAAVAVTFSGGRRTSRGCFITFRAD